MLPSGLPERVADDEDLARFLTQSSQFNRLVVKPAAFLPSPKSRETSVSRHGREPRRRLWEIGLEVVSTRKLYGAAIFKAAAVRAAELDVYSSEPPLLHAAIRDWCWVDADPDLQKAKQREQAVLVASAAGEPILR